MSLKCASNKWLLNKNIFRHLLLIFFIGCGVEAGNPDSTDEKNSFINISITDAPIDEIDQLLVSVDRLEFGTERLIKVNLNLDGPVDIASLTNGKKLQILADQRVNSGNYTDFYLVIGAQDKPIQAIQKDGSLVNIVILDESESLSNELSFSGNVTLNENETKNLIVDVDLRQTLTELTDKQRQDLKLDSSYKYALRKKHSFLLETEAGSLEVTGYEEGSILCLVPRDAYTTTNLPSDCLGEGNRSSVVSSEQFAKIIAIKPGKYILYQIQNESIILIQSEIEITEQSSLKIEL